MGTEGLDFLLKSRLDGAGLEAAQRELKKTGAAAGEAGEQLKELGYSAGKLKAAFLEAFALAEVLSQFKEGWKDVVETDAAMKRMAMTAKGVGEEFEKVKERAEELAAKTTLLGRATDHEAVKAFEEMYRKFGTLENATKAYNLALGVSVKTGWDLGKSIGAVTMAAAGRAKALATEGILLDKNLELEGKQKEALEALVKWTKDAEVGTSSLNYQQKQISYEWDKIRENATRLLLPVFQYFINGAKTIGAFWGTVTNVIVGGVSAAITSVGQLGQAMTLFFQGKFKQAWELAGAAAKGPLAAMKQEASIGAKQIEDIWTKVPGKISAAVSEAPDPFKAMGVKAGKEAAKAASERLATEIRVLKAMEEAEADSVKKRVLRVKAYALEYEKALADLVVADKSNLANRQAEFSIYIDHLRKETAGYATEYKKNVALLNVWLQKNNEKIEKEITKTTQEETERRTAIIVAGVHERIAAEKEAFDRSVEMSTAGIGLAKGIFGDSKEIAIAEAIINTYVGASKALSQGGVYGVALAAIVIAAGLAQVATIASTNPGGSGGGTSANGPGFSQPGGGFDNPANDRAAFDAGYLGGRGWAADQIHLQQSGLARGYSDGMRLGSSTTNNNQKSVTNNIGGIYIQNPNDRGNALRMKRELDRVTRQVEDARTTARAARTTV